MLDWDNDEIDPQLDFLLNQIGELALRHTSVWAHLPIPGYDNTTDTLPTLLGVRVRVRVREEREREQSERERDLDEAANRR